MDLNETLAWYGNRISAVEARQYSLNPNDILYSAVGERCFFGCKVTQGVSATDMIVALEGRSTGDEVNWNPGYSASPERGYQYSNIASGKDGAIRLQDTTATIDTAPATGLARIDIAYIYVGPFGAGFAIQTGTASSTVAVDFLTYGLDTAAYGAARLTDPALPVGALPVARIYVSNTVTGIPNSRIADLRNKGLGGAFGSMALQSAGAVAIIGGTISGLTLLSLGSIPATSGLLRLSNNGVVKCRNAANSADLDVLQVDTSNELRLYGTAVRISGTGNVAIGDVTSAYRTLRVSKSITGATEASGVLADGPVQSDVTSIASQFRGQAATANTAFTLNNFRVFYATAGSFGSATVTNLIGFHADATLAFGANNYGFYSALSDAATTYAYYGGGTAKSAFLGDVLVGSTTAATGNPQLDVVTGSSTVAAVFADTTSDATTKTARLGGRHYTNSEEPVAIAVVRAQNGQNNLYIGGGTSSLNAATDITFFTAGGSVTTVGTGRWIIPGSGHMRPVLDNTYNFGDAFTRVKEIFCANSTINTSDAREKTELRALSVAEKTAALQIKDVIGMFQFLNAIQEKGEAARLHVGVTVQSVIEIMQLCGLEPFRYSFICYDEWEESRTIAECSAEDPDAYAVPSKVQRVDEQEITEHYVEVIGGVAIRKTRRVVREVPAFETLEVQDEAGAPVMEVAADGTQRPMTYDRPIMVDGLRYEKEVVRPAGNMYSLRVHELLYFILAAM